MKHNIGKFLDKLIGFGLILSNLLLLYIIIEYILHGIISIQVFGIVIYVFLMIVIDVIRRIKTHNYQSFHSSEQEQHDVY